jgi:hypothetical protein
VPKLRDRARSLSASCRTALLLIERLVQILHLGGGRLVDALLLGTAAEQAANEAEKAHRVQLPSPPDEAH